MFRDEPVHGPHLGGGEQAARHGEADPGAGHRGGRGAGRQDAGGDGPLLRGVRGGDLDARMEELEAEKLDLEARRERLELPAVDRDMLAALVDNFERVMAEGPAPPQKHLLHRLVKKVLVPDRRTGEIWHGLPNPQRFADWNKWLPGQGSNLQPSG
jgi:hypothetical protein